MPSSDLPEEGEVREPRPKLPTGSDKEESKQEDSKQDND